MDLKTPKLHTLIAIDPGVSGAMAVLNNHGIHHWHMPKKEGEVVESLLSVKAQASLNMTTPIAVIEQVNGFMGKKRPGARMFTMGNNYGFIRGVLGAMGIPVTLVTPRKWQGDLNFFKDKEDTREEWKRFLANEARRIYRNLTITKQDADAILLLHWARLHMDIL